jgi:hypothetical protein
MEEDENIELEFPTFSAAEVTEGLDFEVHYRKEIAEAVHLALDRMIEYDLEEIPVFAILETESVFMLDRDSMPTAVDGCIEYYKEIEEYEMCNELLKLKSEL